MSSGGLIVRAAVAVTDPPPTSAASRSARRSTPITGLALRSAAAPRPRLRLALPRPPGVRPGPIALPGGLLVAAIGDPPSEALVRWAAAWTVAAGARRVHLLHVREVPDTLPLGAWPLDLQAVARLQAWVAELRSRGLRAELEVADTRRGERTVVERAAAMAARTVLLGRVRTPRGGLDRRAPYVLRRLPGIEVVLFSE